MQKLVKLTLTLTLMLCLFWMDCISMRFTFRQIRVKVIAADLEKVRANMEKKR